MLREIYLKIQDTVQLQVFFVAPAKEETYVAESKDSFLTGTIHSSLKYSKNITIDSGRLRLMWANTRIFVLKPAQPWIDTLRPYR